MVDPRTPGCITGFDPDQLEDRRALGYRANGASAS